MRKRKRSKNELNTDTNVSVSEREKEQIDKKFNLKFNHNRTIQRRRRIKS